MRSRAVPLLVALVLAATAAPSTALQSEAPPGGAHNAETGASEDVSAQAETALELQSTSAAGPTLTASTPVAPGVQRLSYRLNRSGGAPVFAEVLQVQRRDDVRITAELGQGTVRGLETVRDMNRRLQPRGRVAMINGGYWLNQPVGEPNSYFAWGGRLVSESETQGDQQRGARGTFAVGALGPIIDRIDAKVHLRQFWPDREPTGLPITGVNRLDRTTWFNADGPDALYLYTPEFGTSVTVPSGRGNATAMPLPGLVVPAVGAGTRVPTRQFLQLSPGQSVGIPADGALLLAYGQARNSVGRLWETTGTTVQAVTDITFPERKRPEQWGEVLEGLAAGPLIVREGQMTNPDSWATEGFPSSHTAGPSPRSAIGVRADGTTLMVAVDGRQYDPSPPAGQPPLYGSAGLTMRELAQMMIDLGAVDALALDGGGSTQLSVDGIIRNRPCSALRACGPLRPVATGLAVVHDYEHQATERLSGSGREATAAAVALAAYPEGSDDAVLASAGDFPDALAGGPLASALGAPLLLTGRDRLADVTQQALRQLGVRRITLLGGSAVISDGLAQALQRAGFEVRRRAGTGRVETSASISRLMGERHERIFLAAAGDFPDALSAAAPAGLLRSPILLTNRDRLHPAAREEIARARPAEVVIVGGTGVIGAPVEAELRALGVAVRRLSGSDRFGTARAINEWAAQTIPDLNPSRLVVARGDAFPDALAGGPFAASQRSLLMIVPADNVRLAPHTAAYLDARAPELSLITLLGGLGVISSYQHWQLDQVAR